MNSKLTAAGRRLQRPALRSAGVSVVEAAEVGDCDDVALALLDQARRGRVAIERQVSTRFVDLAANPRSLPAGVLHPPWLSSRTYGLAIRRYTAGRYFVLMTTCRRHIVPVHHADGARLLKILRRTDLAKT